MGVFGAGGYSLPDMLNSRPDIQRRLGSLSIAKAAAAFGALLLVPDLHATSARIEAMIHLAVANARGSQSPSGRLAADLFEHLASVAGHLEDPAEDLMVEAVRSPWGNFRVLPGLWEGAGFFLQRFVDVVSHMPDGERFDLVRRSTLAMLRLSEEVCARAALNRHEPGAEMPVDGVHKDRLARWMRGRAHLSFTAEDLRRLAIDPADLEPFVLRDTEHADVVSRQLGDTVLERHPLVLADGIHHLVLPNAVTAAIRYRIVHCLSDMGLRRNLARALTLSYAQLFYETQLIGGVSGAELDFRPDGHALVAEIMIGFDSGRMVHFLFFADTLDGFDETGLSGVNPSSACIDDMLERRIARAYAQAAADPGYKEGMTLLVGCGIGRGAAIAFGGDNHPGWRIESCPAHDLVTMSSLDRFRTANLWRILQARDCIRSLGVSLLNVNGLLNMISWSRSLDGHLVPHGDVPEGQPGGKTMMLLEQNGLRSLRREAALATDLRVERFVDGEWMRLRRDPPSVFNDDRDAPVYGSEDPGRHGKPMVAYVSGTRTWWADVASPRKAGSSIAYERWMMAGLWLARTVPTLETRLTLPEGPILWDITFEGDFTDRRMIQDRLDYAAARASITIDVDKARSTIATRIGPDFDKALFHPENIAERALVSSLAAGAAMLAGHDDPAGVEAELLPLLIHDPAARHSHAFAQRGFRDHVRANDAGRNVIKISREDDAYTRLGLGWSVRDRASGPTILGKSETTAFLNSLVTRLEDELIDALRGFDRRRMLERLLQNHELAIDDRDRWTRTSSALLALHGRTTDTFKRLMGADQSLNAVLQSTRVLVEMAICECPLAGGARPGRLDISLLMAKASLLFEIGGWSDAIRWDVMKPDVRVTPLGDVHANFDYYEEIIIPHASVTNQERIERAVTGYAKNLEERVTADSVVSELDRTFARALEEQMGGTIDDLRLFTDAVELIGIEQEAKVITLERTRFESLTVGAVELPAETANRILQTLTLVSRLHWRDVPDGYEIRDRQPWRFRRQLSFLRRPILDWDPAGNTVMVAPGMLRDSLVYMYSLYESGDFPVGQLTPKMAAWRAFANGRRGTVFAEEVAEEMRGNGWQAEVEVKITKLLGRGFDTDHGDVDVLAWRDDGRVLIIECKDVQFRKTLGEMSEQLADFRGETKPNGKRDELRKHLDRIEILREHLPLVARYVGMPSINDVESHLLFRNPMPMEFALRRMAKQVKVSNFATLASI